MKKSMVGILVLCLVGVACSSNPSAGAFADEYGGALCQRLEDCDKAIFDLTYPKGHADCVAQIKAAVVKDTSAKDACTQSQVDTCTQDTKNLSCDAINKLLIQGDSSVTPGSCNGC